MESIENTNQIPYGTFLGSYQDTPAYSNETISTFTGEENIIDQTFTGLKYLSLEYLRRWLLGKKVWFHSVRTAAQVWEIQYFNYKPDDHPINVRKNPNGNIKCPKKDAILVWNYSEELFMGHVGIITEVNENEGWVRIAEQNYENQLWDGDFSRELPLVMENEMYWIRDKNEILGWIEFDANNQADLDDVDWICKPLIKIVKNQVNEVNWDMENCIEKAFISAWGYENFTFAQDCYKIHDHLAFQVNCASLEIGYLLLRATDFVINNDELLGKLAPKWVWGRVRKSWQKYWYENGKCIAGRLNFRITGRFLKFLSFEGNSLMDIYEAIEIQEKLGNCLENEGKSPGGLMKQALIAQLKDSLQGFVHICHPNTSKAQYTALYLKQLLDEIGISSKTIIGNEFNTSEQGYFVDCDMIEIINILSLWEWEDILDDYEKERPNSEIKISDLLINDNINVLDPLWKIVTGNMAINAVLYELFPLQMYLLKTKWDIEEGVMGYGEVAFRDWSKEEQKSKIFVENHNFDEDLIITSWTLGNRNTGFYLKRSSKFPNICPLVFSRVIN